MTRKGWKWDNIIWAALVVVALVAVLAVAAYQPGAQRQAGWTWDEGAAEIVWVDDPPVDGATQEEPPADTGDGNTG